MLLQRQASRLRPGVPTRRPLGRYIFAYCNVRTKQVLYTLHQNLKDRNLKQLPDLGANNTPPSIRQDSWKPFFTITFPETEKGLLGGLETFRRLREWRYMHEHYDELPEIKQRTTEEVEKLEDRLQKRGGSKLETPGKLIRRANRRVRVRAIMDQKANSVADLANVLTQLEKEGFENRQKIEAAIDGRLKNVVDLLSQGQDAVIRLEKRRDHWKSLLELPADELKAAENISRAQLRQKIDAVDRRLRMLRLARLRLDAGGNTAAEKVNELRKDEAAARAAVRANALSSELARIRISNLEASDRISRLKTRLAELREEAAPGSSEGDEGQLKTSKERERRAAKLSEDILRYEASMEASMKAVRERLLRSEKAIEDIRQWKTLKSEEIDEIVANSKLPEDIKESSYEASKKAVAEMITPKDAPGMESLRAMIAKKMTAGSDRSIELANKRDFETMGVRIQWQDPLDAEFAEAWPSAVKHDPMGITQHTAPHPDGPALLDSGDWSSRRTVLEQAEQLREARRLRAAGQYDAARDLESGIEEVEWDQESQSMRIIRPEEQLARLRQQLREDDVAREEAEREEAAREEAERQEAAREEAGMHSADGADDGPVVKKEALADRWKGIKRKQKKKQKKEEWIKGKPERRRRWLEKQFKDRQEQVTSVTEL